MIALIAIAWVALAAVLAILCGKLIQGAGK